jgi:hypothetical protein
MNSKDQKKLWKASGTKLSFKKWLAENNTPAISSPVVHKETEVIPPKINSGYEYLPKKISQAELIFGAKNMNEMMPPYDKIDRKALDKTNTVSFIENWFFSGIKIIKLTPRPGIDTNEAISHIKSIMSSFAPKHEHKTYGCAYLMDLWFEDIQWDRV